MHGRPAPQTSDHPHDSHPQRWRILAVLGPNRMVTEALQVLDQGISHILVVLDDERVPLAAGEVAEPPVAVVAPEAQDAVHVAALEVFDDALASVGER